MNVANNENPTPLEGLGRFAHEAVVVDPTTGIVYLTEDASGPNGLLYRATPTTPLGGYGSLRDGAMLEALVAFDGRRLRRRSVRVHRAGHDARRRSGRRSPTRWPRRSRHASQLNQVTRSTQVRGDVVGRRTPPTSSASYARNDDGSVAEHDGQVWRLDPARQHDGPGGALRRQPRSGQRQLRRARQHHRVAVGRAAAVRRRRGRPAPLHREPGRRRRRCSPATPATSRGDGSEFTGATFSADGETLFVNLQDPGVTFAITGPWDGEAAPSSSTPDSSAA